MTDETYGIDAALGVGQPYAEYEVLPGWGYKVFIYDEEDLLVDEYTAGDCQYDSQVYGTGDLGEETLREFAIGTARELLNEKGYTDAQIHKVDS